MVDSTPVLPDTDQAQALLSKGVIDAPTYNAIIDANKGYPQDYNKMLQAGSLPAQAMSNNNATLPPPDNNRDWIPDPVELGKRFVITPPPDVSGPKQVADTQSTDKGGLYGTGAYAETPPAVSPEQRQAQINKEKAMTQHDFEQNQLARQSQMQLGQRINALSNPSAQPTTPVIPSVLPAAPVRGAGGVGGNADSQYLSSLGKVGDLEQQAADTTKASYGNIGQIQADLENKTAAKIDQYVANDKAERIQQDATYQQAVKDANTSFEAIRQRAAAMQDIDPRHWYKTAGVGGSILAAISVGLGALGSGLSGMNGRRATPNAALEIINGAIDKDIDAQKSNWDKQWKQISLDKGIADDKFAQAKFMDARENEARAHNWFMAGQELKSMANSSQAQIDPQHAAIMQAGIDDQLSKLQLQNAGMRHEVMRRQEAQSAAASAAAANAQPISIKVGDRTVQVSRGAILQAEQDYASYHKTWKPSRYDSTEKDRDTFVSEALGLSKPSSGGAGGSAPVENPVNLNNGEQRSAISKAAQTQYTDLTRNYDNVNDSLTTAIKLVSENPNGGMSGADQAVLDSAIAQTKDWNSTLKGTKRAPGVAEMREVIDEHLLQPYESNWGNKTWAIATPVVGPEIVAGQLAHAAYHNRFEVLPRLVQLQHQVQKQKSELDQRYLMPAGKNALPDSSSGDQEEGQ